MTLQEIFDHGKEAAQHLFNVQGEIHPMWIIETKGGKIAPMIVQMDDKDRVVKAIKKALNGLEAVRYVSILEAWMLDISKDRDLPESIKLGAPVSQHPDRREILTIYAEDKVDGSMSGYFYILRPETGKPRLSAFKEAPRSERNEGRFVNLFS